jgi:hypothetical protein
MVLVERDAEPVGPDYRARMDDDSLTHRAAGVNRHCRIDMRVAPDADPRSEARSGTDHRAFCDLCSGADHRERPDFGGR